MTTVGHRTAARSSRVVADGGPASTISGMSELLREVALGHNATDRVDEDTPPRP
jgi:hypothetical protein